MQKTKYNFTLLLLLEFTSIIMTYLAFAWLVTINNKYIFTSYIVLVVVVIAKIAFFTYLLNKADERYLASELDTQRKAYESKIDSTIATKTSELVNEKLTLDVLAQAIELSANRKLEFVKEALTNDKTTKQTKQTIN